MSIQYPIYCARVVKKKEPKSNLNSSLDVGSIIEKSAGVSESVQPLVNGLKQKKKKTLKGTHLPKPLTRKPGSIIEDSTDEFVYEEQPQLKLFSNQSKMSADTHRYEYCRYTGLLLRYDNRDVCLSEVVNGERRSILTCEDQKCLTVDVAVWWNMDDKFLLVSFAGIGRELCSFYMFFFLKDTTFLGIARQFQVITESIALRWNRPVNWQRPFDRSVPYEVKSAYTQGLNFDGDAGRLKCNLRWIIWSGNEFFKARRFNERAFYLLEHGLVPDVTGNECFSEELSTYVILHDKDSDEYLLVLNGSRDHFSFKKIKQSDFSFKVENDKQVEVRLYDCSEEEAVSYEGRFFFFSKWAFETNISIPYTFQVKKEGITAFINSSLIHNVIPMEFAPINASVIPSASVPHLCGVILSSTKHHILQFDVIRQRLSRNEKVRTNMSIDAWRGLYYSHPSLRDVIFLHLDLNVGSYLGVETSLSELNVSFAKQSMISLLDQVSNFDFTHFDTICMAMFSIFRCKETFTSTIFGHSRQAGGSEYPIKWIELLCAVDLYQSALVDYNIYTANNGSVLPAVSLLNIQTNPEFLCFLSPLNYNRIRPILCSTVKSSKLITVELYECTQELIIAEGVLISASVVDYPKDVCWKLNSGTCAKVSNDKWICVVDRTIIFSGFPIGEEVSEPSNLGSTYGYAFFSYNDAADIDMEKFGYKYPTVFENAIDFGKSDHSVLVVNDSKLGVNYTNNETILYVPKFFLESHFSQYGTLGSPSFLHTAARSFLNKQGIDARLHPSSYGLLADHISSTDSSSITEDDDYGRCSEDENDYD